MSNLPTMEQILNDPITKKFVFLTNEEYPNQTLIGLTNETKYGGVVYKYGKDVLPFSLLSKYKKKTKNLLALLWKSFCINMITKLVILPSR